MINVIDMLNMSVVSVGQGVNCVRCVRGSVVSNVSMSAGQMYQCQQVSRVRYVGVSRSARMMSER